MDFLSNIKDNSILLIPNNIRDKVLEEIDNTDKLINIKIMTFNDLKKGMLYDYNNEAIYKIMTNFNLNYQVSKSHIEDTYYLSNANTNNAKWKNIKNIYDYLESNNLLIRDNLFINLIKSKSKLYIFGFDTLTKFNNYLIDLVSEYIEIEHIEKQENDYKHVVYELNTMEEEIIYVCEEISKLIEKGIPLNKIFIANYSNEYYFTFKKIFNLYNIPYYIKSETKLSDTVIGKYFVDNLSNNMDKLLYKIKNKFNIENDVYKEKVLNKINNLVNTYYWCDDYTSIKDLIIAEMNYTSIPSDHFEEEIKTTNLIDNIFNDDEYIFLIGFNLGSIPRVKRDEDYIDDSIKTKLQESTVEKNEMSKNNYLKVIKNIKNLTITYKKNSNFEVYYPSMLIDDDILTKEIGKVNPSNFSNDINKLLFASSLDKLIKFNEKNDLLSILNNNYDIEYKNYSNKFTGISKDIITEKLENKAISYSTISNYYKCPFKFYLSYLFRLDKYEQTLDAFIGSLFHHVMEVCISDTSKDIDYEYNKFIEEAKEKRNFDDKEMYYIEKIREEIHFIIDNVRKQYSYADKDKMGEWHEETLTFNNEELDLDTSVPFILTGIIDKVIFIDNDCVIVDYKTGTSDKIDRDLFEFGITIQLPIYLYLLKNKNSNYNIVGMYLQHILQGLIKRDKYTEKKSVDDIRLDRLKLDGITSTDVDKIKNFDNSYSNSRIIQGLKLKEDGEFSNKKRVMDEEEQEEIYNKIKNLLEDAINNIANSNFSISPLVIESKYINGCSYCKYKDICYMKKSDIRYEEIKQEEGDANE